MDQKQGLRPGVGFTRWVAASGIMLLAMAAAPSYDGPPNDGQPFCPPGRTCATSQTASDCGSCCDTNAQCTACCTMKKRAFRPTRISLEGGADIDQQERDLGTPHRRRSVLTG